MMWHCPKCKVLRHADKKEEEGCQGMLLCHMTMHIRLVANTVTTLQQLNTGVLKQCVYSLDQQLSNFGPRTPPECFEMVVQTSSFDFNRNMFFQKVIKACRKPRASAQICARYFKNLVDYNYKSLSLKCNALTLPITSPKN